jgi:hypothetical protein
LDIERVFALLGEFFDREEELFVVVGGLAMLSYGATRNTYDCDLLVRQAVRERLRSFLERAGYDTRAESPAFSSHVNRDLDLGRLDILYVDDETARQVFAARRTARLGGNVSVALPSPDHLIAMKAQSLHADPERRGDVEDLLTLLAREDVDQGTAARQFEANGLTDLYRSLLERMRRQ